MTNHHTGICKSCYRSAWVGEEQGPAGYGLRKCLHKGKKTGQVDQPKAGLMIVNTCSMYERAAGAD